MQNDEIGTTRSVSGVMNGLKYNIFCMKDVDYTMKLMTTYGSLTQNNIECKVAYRNDSSGNQKSFNYTECFANHFKYRHNIDDHNNLRHATPSIESTWLTQRWAIRVFSFLLAISEVNTFLSFRFFVWSQNPSIPKLSLLEFRRKLAVQLIDNDHWKEEQERKVSHSDNRRRKKHKQYHNHHFSHQLLTAPAHASFFTENKWHCNNKTKYPQFVCKAAGCKKRIRTYCSCFEGQWMCNEHFLIHLQKEVTNDCSGN